MSRPQLSSSKKWVVDSLMSILGISSHNPSARNSTLLTSEAVSKWVCLENRVPKSIKIPMVSHFFPRTNGHRFQPGLAVIAPAPPQSGRPTCPRSMRRQRHIIYASIEGLRMIYDECIMILSHLMKWDIWDGHDLLQVEEVLAPLGLGLLRWN